MAGRHTSPTLTPSPAAEPMGIEPSAVEWLVPAEPRHHLLAAEHAALSAERGSGRAATGIRVGGYLVLVGAGAVSLAVAGRVDGFGDAFRTFGIVVLALLLAAGLLTAAAVHSGRRRDRALAADQDALRAAWMDADPEAFVPPPRAAPAGAWPVLGGDAALMVLLVAVTAGALGGLVADALGGDATADGWTAAVSGLVVGALTALVLGLAGRQRRSGQPLGDDQQARLGAEPGTVELVPAPPDAEAAGPEDGAAAGPEDEAAAGPEDEAAVPQDAAPPAPTLPAQRSSGSQEPPSQG